MFSEIYEMLGDDIGGRFCVTFVPGRSAVLQGYKKIVKISDEQIIVLLGNKKMVQVCGKYLSISSLAPSELVVKGKVEMEGEYYEEHK